MNRTSDTRSRLLALAAASMLAAGLTGCATSSDINGLTDRVSAAEAAASAAQADAAAARQDAVTARSMAEQAMGMANDAKASADASEAKIDRMFKKAMYK